MSTISDLTIKLHAFGRVTAGCHEGMIIFKVKELQYLSLPLTFLLLIVFRHWLEARGKLLLNSELQSWLCFNFFNRSEVFFFFLNTI